MTNTLALQDSCRAEALTVTVTAAPQLPSKGGVVYLLLNASRAG